MWAGYLEFSRCGRSDHRYRACAAKQPALNGSFALLELHSDLAADRVRRHLLDSHDTGLVSIGERYLRIAFCSVRNAALPGLVERLAAGVAELRQQATEVI